MSCFLTHLNFINDSWVLVIIIFIYGWRNGATSLTGGAVEGDERNMSMDDPFHILSYMHVYIKHLNTKHLFTPKKYTKTVKHLCIFSSVIYHNKTCSLYLWQKKLQLLYSSSVSNSNSFCKALQRDKNQCLFTIRGLLWNLYANIMLSQHHESVLDNYF